MTLQQLHQVITIAESRSMNEASRKLFVSQPNLSAGVRELGEEAGITIFIRSNRGIVLTRDNIMDRIWSTDYEGESRTLDVHIKTLRHKLGDAGNYIKTVRNVGYFMDDEAH